jgi:hypothetical protein
LHKWQRISSNGWRPKEKDVAREKIGIEAIDALSLECYEIKRFFSLRPMGSDDAARLRALPDAGRPRREDSGTIHEQQPAELRGLLPV